MSSKSVNFRGDLVFLPHNTRLLRQTRVHIPNRIFIISAVLFFETGIDISLILVACQNKKQQLYIVCWHVRSRWHQPMT